MPDTGPVIFEIEPRAVVFNVAQLAGLSGLFAETRPRRTGMLDPWAMADFALDVFQARGVKLADKTAGLLETDRVADKTFRVKSLVGLDQSLIGPAMARLAPDFMLASMAVCADGVCGKNFGFIFIPFGRQRSEKQFFYLLVIARV